MKKLIIAERLALVVIVLICLDLIADTFGGFATPISAEDVQYFFTRSIQRHSVPVGILAIALLASSFWRRRIG